MTSLISFFRSTFSTIGVLFGGIWNRYRALSPRMQWIVGVVLAVLVIVFFSILRSGGAVESTDTPRAVSVESVGSLSSGEGSATLFGSVRSITEAEVVAKTSGTVEAVYVRIGQNVGAGTILASMDNDSEAAAVLSAEGAYEAAVASRENSGAGTFADVKSTYEAARTTIDSVLAADIDPLFSGSSVNRNFRLNGEANRNFADRYDAILTDLEVWRLSITRGETVNPTAMIAKAKDVTLSASTLVSDISVIAERNASKATETEKTNLRTGRATLDGLLSSIRTVENTYNADEGRNGGSVSDAQVKQALGALRSAQANFERTVIRSPIAGTVNFLPIRVGDYIVANTHAATVARNGALEITAFVSEEDRALLAVGDAVRIDDNATGTITSIAPALDPVSKQIEVRIAAENTDGLVNGQSVRVTLMSEPKPEAPAGPLTLPLSSVKLSSGSRVVFSIGEDMRLISHPVEVGQVRGDRIEITSELPLELSIVRDARGLSEGQQVRIATNS